MTLESDIPLKQMFVTEQDLARREAFLAEATDIPSQHPLDALPLTQAGVCDQPVSFRIPSFADATQLLHVSGTMSAAAALPSSQRGVHMSRIVSSIDAVCEATHPSLAACLATLLSEVSQTQGLPEVEAVFDGATIVRRPTSVTGHLSPDRFGVFGRGSLRAGKLEVSVGLGASVMTACPCTQAFSWYSTALSLAEHFGIDVANEVGRHIVGHTHSQRGSLRVELDSDDPGALEWIFEAMRSAAHLTQDLLKRPDEHDLVQRAHERPQFTEDVVRAVAAQLLGDRRLGALPDAELRISCRNVESIHAHDVSAALSGRLVDLREHLNQSNPTDAH